jgi:hypothetical protein
MGGTLICSVVRNLTVKIHFLERVLLVLCRSALPAQSAKAGMNSRCQPLLIGDALKQFG